MTGSSKQSIYRLEQSWIASSLSLLAMTARESLHLDIYPLAALSLSFCALMESRAWIQSASDQSRS
jgi:hypothetical protein